MTTPPAATNPTSTPGAPVALITGAGSGIGRAIASALALEGYGLALVGRRRDALVATASIVRTDRVLCIAADLSRPGEAARTVRECAHDFGRLDVLVHNAGLGRAAPIDTTSMHLVRETMQVNALAPAEATLEAWPTFMRQRSGRVLFISSMAALDPFPGFFAYAASKGAMNMLAASVAKEGASVGVRAWAICPGAVETDMLRASFDEAALPRDQCLQPEDVARVVVRCVRGELDARNGGPVPVLPPSARAWLKEWLAARDLSPA
jgi:meso-butanediol dehydrogenase/(S,S)-butanediol dehydrogenase/diacetyl reductase